MPNLKNTLPDFLIASFAWRGSKELTNYEILLQTLNQMKLTKKHNYV